jgi:hypothetical protein
MDLKEMEDSVNKVSKSMKKVHRTSLKFAKHAHEYLEGKGKPIPKILQKLMVEAREVEKEEDEEEKKSESEKEES